eukprot:11226869-Lingulodinium_polyedra.AAC.1
MASGAAVVRHRARGQWVALFTVTRAFPCGAAARAAEVWAGRAVLEALRRDACPSGTTLCSGDNLAIV